MLVCLLPQTAISFAITGGDSKKSLTNNVHLTIFFRNFNAYSKTSPIYFSFESTVANLQQVYLQLM